MAHVVEVLQRVQKGLLDLIFPPRCVGCRQVGCQLCAQCREQIEYIHPPLCPRCGRALAASQLCPSCRLAPLQIDGIRSVAIFDGPLRQAIHRFKYTRWQELASIFGEMLGGYWRAAPLPADVIVPVPLHPNRLRERGYNQAALLAREVGEQTGLPVVEHSLLRIRETLPQVTLNARQRKENVRAAFRCVDDTLRGQRVLLMDDVCTTGATLEACSVALRQQVASVWALTLARAR